MCWLNCHVRYCSNQSSVAVHIQLHAIVALSSADPWLRCRHAACRPPLVFWLEMLRRGELQTALGGGANMFFPDSWLCW